MLKQDNLPKVTKLINIFINQDNLSYEIQDFRSYNCSHSLVPEFSGSLVRNFCRNAFFYRKAGSKSIDALVYALHYLLKTSKADIFYAQPILDFDAKTANVTCQEI